jgi:hypothetical protein
MDRKSFFFSPLQSILVNKHMPRGFKIESEENMVKAVENIRPVAKKQKTSVSFITKIYFLNKFFLE